MSEQNKIDEKSMIKQTLDTIKKQYEEMLEEEENRRQEPKIAPEGVYVSLQNVNKVYDNYVQAVFDFSLDIMQHEFIVFVGPSGCGKSTTLRMIAGLEDITTGDLYIDGQYCNEKTAKERDIAMVFQNYALYPHMSVYENMAFGLETRGYGKEEIDARVKRAAEILQITQYLDRRPKELSGGQMQRVALGRAIVREAKVFLMDEPLSNLDAKLRVSMRSEIIKLHREINATTVYVTHDQTEAMTMADRIVVMKDGYIQQIGTPKEVYNNPANVFVATFIGAPAMNLVECVYDNGKLIFPDGFTVQLTDEQISLHDEFYKNAVNGVDKKIEDKVYENPDINFLMTYKREKFSLKNLFRKKQYPKLKTAEEKLDELLAEKKAYEDCLSGSHALTFGIRPEDMYENKSVYTHINASETLSAKVNIAELLGSEYHVYVNMWNTDFIVKCKVADNVERGDEFEFVLDLNKIHVFDKTNKKSIF